MVDLRSDASGDSVPQIVRWQSWAVERAACIRLFDAGAVPAAFPEYPLPELAPGTQVWVIYNDDGLPMKGRGTLETALADAAANGFVVLEIEWGENSTKPYDI